MPDLIATGGLTLGLANTAALFWHWRQAGPVVETELEIGWQIPVSGGIVAYTPDSFVNEPPEDGARLVVIVRARNRGRSPVDVDQWWVRIGDAQLGMTQPPPDTDTIRELMKHGFADDLMKRWDDLQLAAHNHVCPYTLRGHSSASWVVSGDQVVSVVNAMRTGEDTSLSATVHLGNGKVVRSKERHQPSELGLLSDEG